MQLTTKQESAAKAKLRGLILNISTRTPRFLFRVWSNSSGGEIKLNTTEAITPLAFLKGKGPPTIYDISREKITGLAVGHLTGLQIHTVFSSWTHSLPLVLAWAAVGRHSPTAQISIIATKGLHERNVVLFTPSMRLISDRIPSHYDYEFLAFGVFSGEALLRGNTSADGYLYASEAELAHARSMGTFTINGTNHAPDIANALRLSQDIAKLFGPDFELPVMAYSMSCRARSDADIAQIIETLSSHEVPVDWSSDLTIVTDACETGEYSETERAIGLLRTLAEMQHSGDPMPPTPAPNQDMSFLRVGQILPMPAGINLKSNRLPTPTPNPEVSFLRVGQIISMPASIDLNSNRPEVGPVGPLRIAPLGAPLQYQQGTVGPTQVHGGDAHLQAPSSGGPVQMPSRGGPVQMPSRGGSVQIQGGTGPVQTLGRRGQTRGRAQGQTQGSGQA
ncbi:hypothetical protein LTR36_001868 [Oleoguttula mirabilis]|uniref:DUF7587 domain-containing protein n=1 Tax=Oleoguttula mirabilis TaxID=1507867 RepID=A0AAV9JMU0_9PEZI|nr:hypothetical protein LTR36_001868 [Oleoguttula mirabilis]